MHLGNYLLDPDSGVAQKSFALANAIRRAGREVQLVAISEKPKPQETPSILQVHTVSKELYWKEAERFFTSLNADDVVLFRYPFASKALLNLSNRYGKHILFEHNTIEHAEMLLLQRSHFSRQPFSLRPGYLRYAMNTLVLRSTEESRLGGQILKKVKGGVCVSQEIMRYERSRHSHYKTCVIANGADVAPADDYASPELDNELRVVMLIGSEAIWHGYERLIRSLQNAVLSKRVRLLLVGIEKPSNFNWSENSQNKVEWLGRKSKAEVAGILYNCHLAVGTLALYKKSMQEASPLKVRECLFMGLPMILGYYDTDVTADNRFSPFLFRVPNNDTTIDMQHVVDWYTLLSQDANHRQTLAALSREVLSMEAKARSYLNFIDSTFL